MKADHDKLSASAEHPTADSSHRSIELGTIRVPNSDEEILRQDQEASQAHHDTREDEILEIASGVPLPLSSEEFLLLYRRPSPSPPPSSLSPPPPPPLGAPAPLTPPLPGESATSIRSYYKYVHSLENLFPHLSDLSDVLRPGPIQGSGSDLDIHILDQYDDNISELVFVAQSSDRRRHSLTIAKCRNFLLGNMPPSLRCRFILVKDLSRETINLLGETLDLDPEMFAEHAHCGTGRYAAKLNQIFPRKPGDRTDGSSIYKKGIPGQVARPIYALPNTHSVHEARLNSSGWNTNDMRKSYQSLSWYRSVVSQPVNYSKVPEKFDVIWYPNLAEDAKRPQIFRPFLTVGARTLLEERITICERAINDCRVGLLPQIA